jgi:hypothetical protein
MNGLEGTNMDFLAVMLLVLLVLIVGVLFCTLAMNAVAGTMDSISALLETVYNFVHRNDDASTVPTQKPARYLP